MRHLILTVGFVLAAAFSAVAARPATHEKKHSSAELPAAEEMNLASISKTNPFEIVPAAGMELLEELDVAENQRMVSDMIAFAKKHIGTRYVRGGKGPKGFDCSGFTSYVFNQFGYSLNPSSVGQYGQGDKVSRDEVQPGDLLFFTGRSASSGRVGHVGMAISNDPETGEITFIHAAISGGIRIDRISAPYYAARYIGARRVLGY
ncbi:MAG: C40 family peptidase [Muribaculaceae bacterium]|nr:C40 family peptidase [Muribaculaceae bacterium]MDE7141759.1 C40 family peptidase [Muribaculaceae bacterium]